MDFWISKLDYDRAYDHCDLGDSCGVRIYFWPHKDMIPDLIRVTPEIKPGPEPVEEEEK